MPQLSTSYLPGAIQTVTPGANVGGLGPSFMSTVQQMLALRLEAAKRRNADELTARQATNPDLNYQKVSIGSKTRVPVPAGGTEKPAGKTIQQRQQQLALDEMETKQRAMSMAPRTRTVYGAGVVMGPTPDVDSFSGAERQAWLPDSAVARG